MTGYGHVGPEPEKTIEAAFRRFHRDNPRVYAELVKLARTWRQRHPDRPVGISLLYEVLRWQMALSTTGDGFTLNNNYRALYARLIQAQESDLDGVFKTRQLRALDPFATALERARAERREGAA